MKYFAFGSNMLHQRLLERVPGATPLGKACLPGHRLAWHKVNVDGSGKCDIVRDENSTVWGVLYEIDPLEKPGLDRAEGLGRGYSEKTVVVRLDGDEAEACTYYATSIDEGLLPYSWYRDLVLSGAEQNGLPVEYIDGIRAVESIPDRNDHRRMENETLIQI